MRLHFAPLLGLALAACQPKGLQLSETAPPVGPATTAAAASCAVDVQKDWINEETPLRRYTAEAHTLGATCQQAVAVLIIRAREGSPIYTWSGRTEDLLGLYDIADAAAMKPALEGWISASGGPNNTSELPPWEETEGQPKRAEFPFMPESWIDKTAWDQMRADQLDMFCFVQGRESMNCPVLRDGQMEEIGVQLFPG